MEKSPLLLLESDQSLPGQFGCNICGEENQRNSQRRSLCWRSWSAAICQINRQAKNLLKEINYKIPKERERTLKESTIKQDLKRKNCEKEKDKYFHGDAAR